METIRSGTNDKIWPFMLVKKGKKKEICNKIQRSVTSSDFKPWFAQSKDSLLLMSVCFYYIRLHLSNTVSLVLRRTFLIFYTRFRETQTQPNRSFFFHFWKHKWSDSILKPSDQTLNSIQMWTNHSDSRLRLTFNREVAPYQIQVRLVSWIQRLVPHHDETQTIHHKREQSGGNAFPVI